MRWLAQGPNSVFRNFTLRGSLPRMLADLLLINVSVILGFLLWFAFWIVFLPTVDSRQLKHTFTTFYLDNFLFLSAVFLVTFACYGFYTKARRYENRYKMVVVAQAVTVALLVYIFLEYYLFRAPLLPRGVASLIWGLIFLSVGGARLIKGWVERHFRVELRHGRKRSQVENVLVIGGAGYIGSILVRDLLQRNYRVRVLDSLLYGDESIQELKSHARFELMVGDFRNVEAVVKACHGMEAVIHLGAIVGDPACALEPATTLEVNFAATKMVMEISKGYGISRFLFASTCSVYGATDELVDEQSRLLPVSLYAATKVDSENVILYARSPDFHPTVLRIATAFGYSHRPRFDLAVNLLTVRALAEKKITIFNGTQWRPFIHVADIARCFIQVLEAPLGKVSGQVFNAGSSELNFTIRQVAEMIQSRIPVEVEYVENADRRNYRVSFDKISSTLGFTCEKTMADGVLEIVRAYEQNLIGDYRDKRYSNKDYLSSVPVPAEKGGASLPIATTLEFIRKLSPQS